MQIIEAKKTATIDIIVAPSFSQVSIANHTYTGNSQYKIEPGTYTATISAKGFQTQQREITLTDDQTTQLALFLIPDDGDLSWYEKHPEENSILLTLGGIQAAAAAAEYATKYPVSTMLPLNVVEVDPTTYDWTEYRIDCGYFEECKNPDFCIKITDTTGGNREKALQKIRDGGFNPDDYEIIYEYVPVIPLN